MFVDDELPGFEKMTLELPEADDGPLAATLLRTKGSADDRRAAVLYIHGFVDYFFQTHLARAFEDAGYRFYALELRRYGRSLRPGNRACMAWDIAEYREELEWAFASIAARHPYLAGVVAHSTGCLVTATFLADRGGDSPCRSLVLNSPFLRFRLSPHNRALSVLVARLARFAPAVLLPQRLGTTYGKSLHQSESGEWSYDLSKKPLDGVPLYAGWFRMIRMAQARVRKGLHLRLPILIVHSDRSKTPTGEPEGDDFESDLVLDVEDMKRLGPRLGPNVSFSEIRGAVHDPTLSKPSVRQKAIERMVEFVTSNDQ